MKKIFLLATAAFLVTGVTFAENGKDKNKKKKSGKCCSKGHSCKKDEKKTAKM